MNAIPLPDDFGLRPLRADDAPDIFTAIDTQREHLGRWLPFVAATHRVEQTREVVAAMLADPANPVFTLRVGDAFAGLIGFKSADSTTLTIEIGYWLRSEYQGRGLMTAAAEALCRMAFGQMGMERTSFSRRYFRDEIGCKDRKSFIFYNSLSEKYHPGGRRLPPSRPERLRTAPQARAKSRRTYLYINNNINHGKFVIFGRTNTIRHERDPPAR